MRKSLIPVILVLAVAALCLSIAYADNSDRTEDSGVMNAIGAETTYNVTGTVTDSSGVEGASIIISSEDKTYVGTTDSSGSFSISVVPGTYNLAVIKSGYVLLIKEDITVTTADVNVPSLALTKRSAVTGSSITGYTIRTTDDFPGFDESSAKVTLYFRVNANNTLKENYAEIQSSDVNFDTGRFSFDKVRIFKESLSNVPVDRCYMTLTSNEYKVINLSSSCFSVVDTVEYEEDDVKSVFYHLNSSSVASFEDGETYDLGSQMSAAFTLAPATGVVSGTVKSNDLTTVTGGTIVITDSFGTIYGQGNIDSNGKYSITSYVGTDLTISFTSVGFKDGKLNGITVYNEAAFDHDKNVQSDITLEKMGDVAVVRVYIDGKTSKIEDVGVIRAVLYHISNPAETDPTRLTYDSILGEYEDVPIANMDGDKLIGYYVEFRIGQTNCNECFLSINVSGYSVRVIQAMYMEKTTTLMNATDVSGNRLKPASTSTGIFGEGKVWFVGTGTSDAILIDRATGTIKGDVVANTDKATILNGVKVSIVDKKANDVIAYDITSDKGNYSITAPTGEYLIRYEIDGFVTTEKDIKVFDDTIYGPEKNLQPTVKLEAEKGDWFGMDLPHALLVLGGIIAILLIIAALYHRFRILGKKKTIVEDDEKD